MEACSWSRQGLVWILDISSNGLRIIVVAAALTDDAHVVHAPVAPAFWS